MKYLRIFILILTAISFASCWFDGFNECESGDSKCKGNILFYCSYDELNTYWDKEDCSNYGELCTVPLSGDAYCSVSDSACLNIGDKVCTHQNDIGECVRDGDYFIVQAVTECIEPEICQTDTSGDVYCAERAENQ